MAEPTGFDVLKKSFDFELPVTGHKGRLRFATRMDRIIVTEQSPKVAGSDSDDRYELNYLGRIIVELEGKPGPFTYDQLRNYPEKDIQFLRAYDIKLNNLGEDDYKKVVDSFETALKS